MGRKKRSSKAKSEPTNSEDKSDLGQSSTGEYESDLFTCEVSPIYGRFLQSRVEIKKGTIILSEKFLIAGPQRSGDVCCVGCHSNFESPQDRKSCPLCSWPICSDACADTAFHRDECKFFVQKHVKAPTRFGNSDFGSVTVLRGLMLKYQNPEKWKVLMQLEAHNEIRKNLPLWRENVINVVDVILRDWELREYFTPEEVHTVCGILEVNAFELGDKVSYRGIYPKAAMMAHSCLPNTTRFENPYSGILELRAAVDIPPGEPLTICYAFSLEATAQRRLMMSETKFFECSCKRCNDPRELGSNLGTLICQICKVGDVINIGAVEYCQNWVCQSCGSKIPTAAIESQLLIWKEVLDRVQEIPNCEKFLQNCKALFHPTHYIPFDVKFNLCQAYGREGTPLESLTEEDLDRKLELCREVMKILDIVTPGYTVTRGLVLYELQAAEVIKARRLRCKGSILRRKLQLTLKNLQECISILEMCHPESIEYEISQAAKEETLVNLTKWISTLR
ncbi:SET domain-containing protein SmydA-8 [Folsomia candida]|uniref:SET domain-containing protein SmydA-8 n=1 Tax=Folsomia candida TaxID=158441 RepID=UPI000B8F2AB4|nr:SET domain-containing protein SmydA-8 [Folsomia candida]XP_021965918.1 SET domain-containing protein SmydA-8 [Folsomia candida]